MDVRLLLVLLFTIISCTPQSSVSTGSSSSSATTTGGTSGGTNNSLTTVWNYLSSNTNLITINVSNLQNAYLIGNPVEDFLNTSVGGNFVNFSGVDYCLISSYTISGVPQQLRTRVVPVSYYDFTAKKNVRVFRVDFTDVVNSTGSCNLPVRAYDASGNLAVEVFAAPKFDPNLLCPSCTSPVTAGKLRLFTRGTTLDEVPLAYLSLSALTLKVDPNYNNTGNAGTCTNSSCTSLGYDCCLDNQCVRDGSTRPSASLNYPTQLAMAEAERLQNPLAYLNYPHLFYICGSSVPSTTAGGTTGTTTSGSSSGGYDAIFDALKNDLYCVQELKSLASSTPFHNDTLLAPGSHPFNASTKCLTTLAQASATMYYQSVMRRLYQTCGCNQPTLPDMVASCPAYEYVVSATTATGDPASIDCYTPPTAEPPIPTNTSVTLSARSAPHRFFDSTGTERTLTSGASYTQEGDTFSYNDSGYLLPNVQSYGMNSILGQMSVSLDKALPAKIVNVELDQVYLISTQQGHYTPCPTCSKDYWLSTLTAYPSTSYGVGLQAIGHTTARDELSTNTTAGNYEDTIFGRACWVPPTMIPFSHKNNTTAAAQRQDRLRVQAALFANGYQRDWYGFNKGATIGSFDGVSWFAIGKGRLVRSTSKKLFLAINAPFADVATASNQVINVSAYDGISQVTTVDYDPQYHLSHPLQNEAGNCQANHFCTTDTDCISRLGWEYMCADTKDIKTTWPIFDADGNEQVGSTTLSIDQILTQKRYPSASTKRCVYRGAGALCNRATDAQFNAVNADKRKNSSCAPNFYCASVADVSAANAVFNTKVARFAGLLEDVPVIRNHLYGRDANVLGRPLHYVATAASIAALETTTLPSSISSILQANSILTHTTFGSANTGICRPGKALNTNHPLTQQRSKDVDSKTDFISQIAGCNSNNFFAPPTGTVIGRASSCPVIDATTGNYAMFANNMDPSYSITHATAARTQNSCGLDSISTDLTSLGGTADAISAYSPFKLIEAKPLSNTGQTIVTPTFARDACFRRPGQVCQTDLDCAPNKFHAAQVDYFATKFFGNAAEQQYNREYLVCGQADPKPYPSQGTTFRDYNMSLNRCCREVGKDLTTYTSGIPTSYHTSVSSYEVTSGQVMSVPFTTIAQNHVGRYSRYMTVENIGTADYPYPSATFAPTTRSLGLGSLSQNVSTLTPKQWATINEANSETCCGGGWIRKFADGTTNWQKRNRLVLDVTNFQCLNSRTVLLTNPTRVATEYASLDPALSLLGILGLDFLHYCNDPLGSEYGCALFGFISNTNYNTLPPNLPYPTTIIADTLTPNFTSPAKQLDLFFNPMSADLNSSTIMNETEIGARRNISVKIPSFVTSEFETTVATPVSNEAIVSIIEADGTNHYCVLEGTVANVSSPDDRDGDAGINCNPAVPATNHCCYHFNTVTRVLKVVADGAAVPGNLPDDENLGLRIGFDAAGNATGVNRTRPASDAYYLKRLGQFELTGIPQINYEPLYCNDDSDRLVPGLYNVPAIVPGATDKAKFENTAAFSYTDGSLYYTNQHGLAHEPIFAANDFKCCAPLGKNVSAQNTCCSGYGTTTSGVSGYTCALPTGTDLMVYFNRFVSNEGVGTDKPGGGLLPADFEATSGEPKILDATVVAKIAALGNAYCEGKKVRQGGAFGNYSPEPQGPNTKVGLKIYGILDSSNDYATNSSGGQTTTVGYNDFMDGYRWNHHLYCFQ